MFSARLFEGSRSFEENVQRLETYLGHPCSETPVKSVILRNNGEDLRILPVHGKYASVAFFYALAGGDLEVPFETDELHIFTAFFGTKLKEPNHPVLDHMRRPKDAKFTVVKK